MMDLWGIIGIPIGVAIVLILIGWWCCCRCCRAEENRRNGYAPIPSSPVPPAYRRIPADTYRPRTSSSTRTTLPYYSVVNEHLPNNQPNRQSGTFRSSRPKVTTYPKVKRKIPKQQSQPYKVHGYFIKKHVFLIKDIPPDSNKCKFAHAKAVGAYAANCLPPTYTMIFVPDKQDFIDQIGQEEIHLKVFTTKGRFNIMSFKLSKDKMSYLFKERGLRRLCLTRNTNHQVKHLKKTVL